MSALRAFARSSRALIAGRATLSQQLRSFSQVRVLSAQTSKLPQEETEAIKAASLLPNADPTADSASQAFISSQAPYMVATYSRPSPVFTRGHGVHLYDLEGRKYIDFTAGIAVTALGHADSEFLRILNEQSYVLIHTSNLYHNPWTGTLSQLLVHKTKESGGMYDASRAFICNSGSEANEAALKFARKVGKIVGGQKNNQDKYEVVAFNNSFHGRTMGSLSATPNPKYQAPFSPLVPGFSYGNLNDPKALDLITENTCGVIIEPIQGEGGIHAATPEFLISLRSKCKEVGAVLIYDEIQCGMGRTGKLWAHSYLPKEAHPDIITTAKALGNGFPIGATIVTEEVSSKIVLGDHGTTFGGNPLASRLGHYVLGRLSDPALLSYVSEVSKVFMENLEQMQKRWPDVVREIRGKGLILGVQLDRDPTALVKAARERGLLVITAGENTVRLMPALVIHKSTAKKGLKILEDAMEAWLAEEAKS
ncbi:mitochondrial putative acetylornithine aminotransferase [Tirmania nivea]|nr:mitochondrial putative acetylornithine aminotransferase [Tirmania nivea]